MANWGRRFCAYILTVACLTAALSGCSSPRISAAEQYNKDLLNVRLQSLHSAVTEDASLSVPAEGTTVFLSLCNKIEKAKVVHGSGKDLAEAWKEAETKAYRLVREAGLSALWVKADVVTATQELPIESVEYEMSWYRDNGYRAGFSLDRSFTAAFLEAECNSNDLYDSGAISESALQAYTGNENLRLSDMVVIFAAQGYFCGTDNITHKLGVHEDNYGRRLVDMNSDTAAVLAGASVQWLANQIDEYGKFRYGYRAASGADIPGYNFLRHIGSVWPMLTQYQRAPDEELARKIDLAINYFIEKTVVFQDDYTAFILEPEANEIKLGANAMAVIVLTEYAKIFSTDRHSKLCEALGNGILKMGDPVNGSYQHVWNADFSLRAPFRVIYYDGEATLALCKLYGATNNAAYLKMARAAVERFIEQDYTQYKDHWVAYAVNELTKYDPNERYFAFALQNVQNNVEQITSQDTAWHTYLELLTASWDTYDRMLETGASPPYAEQFDAERLKQAIEVRAEKGLSSFCFPEVVMYFEYPLAMYGSFFVRHDDFRTRIDDVQHFACGYFSYASML